MDFFRCPKAQTTLFVSLTYFRHLCYYPPTNSKEIIIIQCHSIAYLCCLRLSWDLAWTSPWVAVSWKSFWRPLWQRWGGWVSLDPSALSWATAWCPWTFHGQLSHTAGKNVIHIMKRKEGIWILRRFQQLRWYQDEIETGNIKRIPFS